MDQEAPERKWLLTGSLNIGWALEMGHGHGEAFQPEAQVGKESVAAKAGRGCLG